MRLLLTTDTIGGVWKFTCELGEGLLESGCDVALVSLGRLPSKEQSAWVSRMQARWGKCFQFTAMDAPLEWMQQNETACTAAAPALLRLAKAFAVDLIHSSQFCFGALQTDVPVIVTAHSDVLSWAASCRPEALEESVWLRRYIALVGEGLAGADAVVAPSLWMLKALEANFKLPRTQRVIPNGRSLGPGATTERRLQAVACGRLWDEGKNIAVLAEVEADFPIFVAGETAHEDAKAPDAIGKARPLGKLDEAELLELFRQSALYLCTSRYEPFGLAPLEAALCGCAIVANDIPSLREVWGDAALYFNDAATLSPLLAALASDPARLAAAQVRAHAHAQRYSREAMTSAYQALYASQLRGSENSRAA